MRIKKRLCFIFSLFLLAFSFQVNSYASSTYELAKVDNDGSTDALGIALENVTEVDSAVLARVSDIANVEVSL